MYVFVQVVIDTNLDDPLYPLIKQHFSSFFHAGKHVEGLACANHTQYRFREHGEKKHARVELSGLRVSLCS